MKCLYYLAPTLSSTHTISDDLHAIGVNDWYIHVLSKDEAGLKREKIHSSNLIETSDALAGALTGAAGGLAIGFLAALLLRAAQPQDLPGFVYALVALFQDGERYRMYFGRVFTGSEEELEIGLGSSSSEQEKSSDAGDDQGEPSGDDPGSRS